MAAQIPASAALDVVLAREHGARGDGTTDDAPAIAAALAACRPGQSVLLDARPYRLASPLVLPDGVGLRGRWGGLAISSIQERVTYAARQARGTVLLNDWSAPSPTDSSPAFLSIGSDGLLADLNVFDLRQGTTPGTFVSRPFMVAMANPDPGTTEGYGRSDNGYTTSASCSVARVNLINPYRGIRLWGTGRSTIKDVFMSAISVGVWCDQAGDTSFLDNVRVVPIAFFGDDGTFSAEMQAYLQANLTCFRFGRMDGMMCSNIMCLSGKVGILLDQSPLATAPRTPWISIANPIIDACDVAIDAYYTALQGVSISGGTLTTVPTDADSIAIRTASTCGDLKFSGTQVVSTAGREVRMAGGNLMFSGCGFNSNGSAPTGSSASIRATGGNLALAGCTFADARPPIEWAYAGGICKTAATVNLGGSANVDTNSRINAGGNS